MDVENLSKDLERVSTETMADIVELRLREFFKKRSFKPGDALPKEMELVAALGVRAAGTLEQAARKSPCKEDNRAACAAQSAAGTGSGTSPDGFRPATQPGGDHGDQAAGPTDRQERRPGAGGNGGRR